MASTSDRLNSAASASSARPAAVAALSFIAEQDTNQTARIKGVLEGVLSMSQAKGSQAKSRVNMSLAKLDPGAKEDHRKLLEDAVASDSSNGEAILRLSKLLLSEDAPDYPRVEQLASGALKNCDPVYRPDLNHLLGEVQVHAKNWGKAIIFLEKSLRGASDKQDVHALLAEAYAALGDDGIAEEHRKLAALQNK